MRLIGTIASLDVDVLAEALHPRRHSSAFPAAVRRGVDELVVATSWVGRTLAGRRDPYFAGLRILLERFYAAVENGDDSPIALEEMDAVNAVVRDVLALEDAR